MVQLLPLKQVRRRREKEGTSLSLNLGRDSRDKRVYLIAVKLALIRPKRKLNWKRNLTAVLRANSGDLLSKEKQTLLLLNQILLNTKKFSTDKVINFEEIVHE